ncbi:hypothetical protein JL722_11688 [Aureococcus anophagefferens]|nr:hypothetical protein JL722_11688 [Aureococcus anophagefferens]
MGKAKAAPAAASDGTAKLAGTAYHAASRSVAAREQALQAAGRLCDNGEKWAARRAASNGEKCRRCKKVVRLARRQFIKRDEGSRLGREVRVVKCDGGCMGQGVSVIVNKWADYGYEAEEEEDDDDGGRRGAAVAASQAAAPRRRRRALGRRARRVLAPREGRRRRGGEARRGAAQGEAEEGARKLLDLGAASALTHDDDAWDKPAPRAPAPAPREAPPPQQPPSMDAFPSLGGGSPRTVASAPPEPPAWEPAYAPEEPWEYAAEEPAYAPEEPWDPAYAPEEPAYVAEEPWSDPWAPEPQNFSPRHFSPEPEVPAPEVRAVRAPARASARELKALPPGLRAVAAKLALTSETLATFLEAFGLQRHVRRFAEEEILSLRDLPHLTLDDLVDMGLSFAEADTLVSAARNA